MSTDRPVQDDRHLAEESLRSAAALWFELGPHAATLLVHLLPHAHPLLVKLFELGLRTPGKVARTALRRTRAD